MNESGNALLHHLLGCMIEIKRGRGILQGDSKGEIGNSLEGIWTQNQTRTVEEVGIPTTTGLVEEEEVLHGTMITVS
jgi:isopentenyl diphosphate isomerase/L-lactate dehydrogenase-like FMN-dependent dehydrogenase